MTSGRMQCPPFLQNSTSPKYLDKVWFPKLGKAPDLGITFKAVTTHPSLIDVKASLIQVLNSIPPYLLLHPHGWCIHMAKCYLVIMCSNLIANQELFLQIIHFIDICGLESHLIPSITPCIWLIQQKTGIWVKLKKRQSTNTVTASVYPSFTTGIPANLSPLASGAQVVFCARESKHPAPLLVSPAEWMGP